MTKKTKKLLIYIIFNVCLFLFVPPVCSLISCGLNNTNVITIKTVLSVLIFNLIVYLLCRKNKKMRINKSVCVLIIAVFIVTLLIIPLSDSYKLLTFSCLPISTVSRTTAVTPVSSITSIEIANNTYLEIYRSKDGGYACALLKKTPLTYHVDEHWCYWEKDVFSDNGLPNIISIPEVGWHNVNSAGYLIVAPLKTNEEVTAFVNENKMEIFADDEVKFAYYFAEGCFSNNYNCQYSIKNEQGESIFQILI